MEAKAERKIGIIGAGALGSYFGIRLAHSGAAVSFLLRSDYEAVRKGGMELQLSRGQVVRVEEPSIVPEAGKMGRMDWIIVGLKTTNNHLLEELLAPVVGPQTLLITIQNGLGNVEALEALYPENAVIAALCCYESP